MKRMLAAIALLAVAPYASAEFMECKNKLISLGDSIVKVSALCGSPARVDRSTIIRSATGSAVNGQGIRSAGEQVEIPVEVWVYNLGPNRLMRQIRFEDGRIVAIETLNYGYRQD